MRSVIKITARAMADAAAVIACCHLLSLANDPAMIMITGTLASDAYQATSFSVSIDPPVTIGCV
ncbi:hypothetical protein GCM10010837_22490 [Aminobacter niigataensis]